MMDFNDPVPAGAQDAGQDSHGGSARKRSRDSLFLMANVRVAGSDTVTAVRVRNLSEGGLMADWTDPPALERAIEIEVRGIGWIEGRVAWHAEGRSGIAFDKPIDPQKARKPVGAGTKTPHYTKAIVTRLK